MMNGPDDFVGPVNLGNPTEFTILDLAEKTIKLTGSKSKIIFKPLPQDDPLQRRPDITLAREKLQWEPVIDVEKGLNKTLNISGVSWRKNSHAVSPQITSPALKMVLAASG